MISSLPSGLVPSFNTIASRCLLRIESSSKLWSLRLRPGSTNIPSKSSPAVPSPFVILTSLELGRSHSKSKGRSFALESCFRPVKSLIKGRVRPLSWFCVRKDWRKLTCRSQSSLPHGSLPKKRSTNRALIIPWTPNLSTS